MILAPGSKSNRWVRNTPNSEMPSVVLRESYMSSRKGCGGNPTRLLRSTPTSITSPRRQNSSLMNTSKTEGSRKNGVEGFRLHRGSVSRVRTSVPFFAPRYTFLLVRVVRAFQERSEAEFGADRASIVANMLFSSFTAMPVPERRKGKVPVGEIKQCLSSIPAR